MYQIHAGLGVGSGPIRSAMRSVVTAWREGGIESPSRPMLELILSYLLDEQFMNRVILVLGIVGPPAGAALGWIVGRIRKQVRSDLVDGLLIGSFYTVALIMWHVYNAVVDRLGLDTVNNLLANLVLFVAVGVGLGFVVRWVRPRLKGEEPGSSMPAAAPPGGPAE